jgi:hypothetical protein
VKVTGATTLRELQQLVVAGPLDVHLAYLGSAAAFRAQVIGPKFADPTTPASGLGIASNLGDALAKAFSDYNDHAKEVT